MFRHQLLGLLRDGNAYHGYALVKEYIRRTGVETNTGYAYRDLQKLVEDGLVEIVANAKGADRRRRPYQITDAGRECFDDWLHDIPQVTLGPDGELAARAIFFDEISTDVVRSVVERWRVDLDLLRKHLEQQIEFPRARGATSRTLTNIQRRRKRLVEAELGFIDDLLVDLPAADSGPGPDSEPEARPDERTRSLPSTLGAARLAAAATVRG